MRKAMKCLLVALSLCLGGTAGLQCLPSEQAVIQAATKKVALNRSSLKMIKGTSYQLRLNNNKRKIRWSSSNAKIASVTSKGTVKAVKNGSAKIYAKVSATGTVTGVKAGKTTIKAAIGAKKYTSTITVKNPSFTLNASKITLSKGQSYIVKPKAAPTAKITWRSSNSAVASVNTKGVILAKKSGSATISAKANGITRTISITVTNPYFNINKTSITLNYGSSAKIGISASPKPSYISWKTTSNQHAASIKSDGTIKAMYIGTASYTATVNGVKRTVKVTVKNPTSSTYNPGWYKVGVNIPAGEYLLTSTNRYLPAYQIYNDGSYYRPTKTTQYPGNGFVTLRKGQYVQLMNCKITKAPSKIAVKSSGTYRVGKDIAAGTYTIKKLKPNSSAYADTASYYVYRNTYFDANPYEGKYNLMSETVTLTNGDVIMVQNAKISRS
ncbi:hypothetical protein HMPREF0863_04149 [Erysipelotrichaceae bacterium 5_2_54FAA]|nr:hypothetical protein HMPREF0863_04149 [Erysipelotrichaceae bacterium 5_2_54FAA]